MARKSILTHAGWQTKEESIANETYKECFVWWLEVTRRHATGFEKCLANASREEDVQKYLEKNPMVLIQHLGGGHGRWVIPKKRLGSEFVTDFIIGQRNSNGYDWQAVELESPNARMFTKAGDPTARLTHAIRQIHDWRAWLAKNQNYAARATSEHGLGLTGISPNLSGLILIGRRENSDHVLERRKQMMFENNIELHSFDFLADNARFAAAAYLGIRNRYNPSPKKAKKR